MKTDLKLSLGFFALLLAMILRGQDVNPHPYLPTFSVGAVSVDTNSRAYQIGILLAKYAPLNPPASAWQAFALAFPLPSNTNQTMHIIYPPNASNFWWHVQYTHDGCNWFMQPEVAAANMPDGHTLSLTGSDRHALFRMIGFPK